MAKCVVVLALLSACLEASSGARVICYFPSWAIYRMGNAAYSASDVDPNLCSHILYAFVGLNENGSVWILDDWEATGLGEVQHLVDLKQQNPNLKVLLSMRGSNGNNETSTYSLVASDPVKRQTNINSVISYIDEHGLDGFDLDWEYPFQCGDAGHPEDVQNFVIWLGELKSALNSRGYILSAAVAGAITSIDISYHIKSVSDNLDLINVMTYDVHSGFKNVVSHPTPLYASHLDQTDEQRKLNVDAVIRHWIDGGADPSKLNLGLSTYGRTFTLADPNNSELFAPTIGNGGQAGPVTQVIGYLAYYEICEFYSDFTYVWDDEQKVPHRVGGNQWIGYEDTNSLAIKVQRAAELGLGGVMIRLLDTDDFLGTCGDGRNPLLTAINDNLW